ncbi:MAG: hypothetical protein SF029_00660 [bacterium]|nr:hypothetical protein [bacterium]
MYKFRQALSLLTLLILALMLGGTTAAQNPDAPLVIVKNGDLWTWDGLSDSLTQITQWGFNEEIRVSPDATQIAYHSLAQVTVEAIEREGGFGGGRLPGNIWIIDPLTGDGIRPGPQPTGASFFTPGVPDNVLYRSSPFWSPSGSQMAWTEYRSTTDFSQFNLIIYDVASSQSWIAASGLPPQVGAPAPMNGVWGTTGIVLFNTQLDPVSGEMVNGYLLYDSQGNPMMDILLPADAERVIVEEQLVTYNDTEYIAIRYNTQEWDLLDLTTGELIPAPAEPIAVSAITLDTSLQIHHGADTTVASRGYDILEADGTPLELPMPSGRVFGRAALSPDGRAAAFQFMDAETGLMDAPVYIWREGILSLVPDIDGNDFVTELAWGPVKWIIPEA